MKYAYEVCSVGNNRLNGIYVVALPNGLLQSQYNPTATNGFWMVGRNAPTRGEGLRVRVSFARLKAKKNWRVQNIDVHPTVRFSWDD